MCVTPYQQQAELDFDEPKCIEKIRENPSPPVPDRGWHPSANLFSKLFAKRFVKIQLRLLLIGGDTHLSTFSKRLLIFYGQGGHPLSATGGVGFR